MAIAAAAPLVPAVVDPDRGTTFAWATRALGPGPGWLGGSAIVVSDLIVIAILVPGLPRPGARGRRPRAAACR